MGGQRLSLEQYKALLDDLAALGVLNVSLSGGEPLAHPRFFDIAAHAKGLGFVVRIKTNGHAVKESVAARIREEVDPFLVEVSLHGATSATHDRQTRVPGSFDRLLANIRGMRAVGLRVKANSVLTRWNEREIGAMLALCDELGIQAQVDPEVKPRDDGDRAPLHIEASADGHARLASAFAERAALRGENGDAARSSATREANGRTDVKHCGAGSNTIAVDPYGRVLPCVQWRAPIGNLHEARISDIWHASPNLREVRETTKAVRRKLDELGDAGRSAAFCPGAAHAYAGDPFSIYPPVERRLRASGRTQVRLPLL